MGKIDRKSIKVLWVSLVKFPPLCEHLGETIPAHCGWMYSSAKALPVSYTPLSFIKQYVTR